MMTLNPNANVEIENLFARNMNQNMNRNMNQIYANAVENAKIWFDACQGKNKKKDYNFSESNSRISTLANVFAPYYAQIIQLSQQISFEEARAFDEHYFGIRGNKWHDEYGRPSIGSIIKVKNEYEHKDEHKDEQINVHDIVIAHGLLTMIVIKKGEHLHNIGFYHEHVHAHLFNNQTQNMCNEII